MTTRRMAWLLAGVVEPDNYRHFHRGAEGVGDGGSDRAAIHAKPGQGEEEEAENGLKSEEAAHISGKGFGAGYDTIPSADPCGRVAAGAAFAKNLATRKRASRFLHQLLVTVRRGGIHVSMLLPQLGWCYDFV